VRSRVELGGRLDYPAQSGSLGLFSWVRAGTGPLRPAAGLGATWFERQKRD